MTLFDPMAAAQADDAGFGRLRGIVLGVVTHNQDPEKLGRVKVRFPCWDDECESTWARIATPMSGSGYGLCCLPEIDDEVLVGFVHGDVRAPCVLGALWNGRRPPPLDNADGRNHRRTLTSRSGHKLEFDDTPGRERLELASRQGHRLAMADAGQREGTLELSSARGHVVRLVDTEDGPKVEIAERSGRSTIVIDTNTGTVTIEAEADIRLSAPRGTLTLEGRDLALRARERLRVDSGSSLDLRAGGSMTLRGTSIDLN